MATSVPQHRDWDKYPPSPAEKAAVNQAWAAAGGFGHLHPAFYYLPKRRWFHTIRSLTPYFVSKALNRIQRWLRRR